MATEDIQEFSFQSEDSSLFSKIQEKKKKKPGPNSSELDSYCRPPFADEPIRDPKSNTIMRYCNQPDCLYGSGVATNFRKHLKSHGIDLARDLQVIPVEAINNLLITPAGLTNSDIQKSVLQKVLQENEIKSRLVRLIVSLTLPFRILEHPEFRQFVLALNPEAGSILYSSHNSLRSLVTDSWSIQREELKQDLLVTKSRIHIALDIWTSPNTYLFLGIVGYFVRNGDKNVTRHLLGLPEIGSHSGDEQFAVLLPVLDEYNTAHRIGAIIGDNATTNDTLCRAIGSWYSEHTGLEWNPEIQRTRCIGHILNLIVQAFLFSSVSPEDLEDERQDEDDPKVKKINDQKARDKFRQMGPIGKLHNITIHIRSSAGRTAEFVREAGRRVPLDNRTRWNSWFKMIEAACSLEKFVDFYAKKQPDLRKDCLTPNDWEWIHTTRKFLQIFHDLTLENQGYDKDISEVLPTLQTVKWHCKAFRSKLQVSIVYFLIFIVSNLV
jgi:hypothetical protein